MEYVLMFLVGAFWTIVVFDKFPKRVVQENTALKLTVARMRQLLDIRYKQLAHERAVRRGCVILTKEQYTMLSKNS